MYARTLVIQIQPNKLDEAVQLFQESVVPFAQQEQGFVSIMLLTDPSTGIGMSVSLWESEAALKANEASGYFQAQLAKFASLFTAPPVRAVYEVSVHA